MRKIVEIEPAPAGWYARWGLRPEQTRTSPVTVWAIVEDDTTGVREVVGVDAFGQWPGRAENEPDWEFVRYVFQPAGTPQPDDLFNPVHTAAERVPHMQR
ncbi:hypothetical protein HC028_11535 [Planosporangium flavigriseum]|uniref:hypothetical protein n=1 Tax=Planosporangium flavigriseum TaxID=373681 RepID=UPI00143A6EA7|nr:hypothetical protein [Planosporangium flavigriseum]NJC65129.1 hypothetical protein [Planosporangium flavigriseum]